MSHTLLRFYDSKLLFALMRISILQIKIFIIQLIQAGTIHKKIIPDTNKITTKQINFLNVLPQEQAQATLFAVYSTNW